MAANRDEFYDRPALPLSQWSCQGMDVYSGQDLKAKGTWLCSNVHGHVAALTNVREPQPPPHVAAKLSSRGALPLLLLTQPSPESLHSQLERTGGCSLVWGHVKHPQQHFYTSNRFETPLQVPLPLGTHILTNGRINDDSWPKAALGRQLFTNILSDMPNMSQDELIETLFESLLWNKQSAPDEALPKTGVHIEIERLCAPIYVTGESYGTRESTVMLYDAETSSLLIVERKRQGAQVPWLETRMNIPIP